MPLAPTVPVAQAALATFAIMSIAIQLEPAIVISVTYAPSDAQGNQTGPSATVQLGAPAIATFQATAGGPRAKFYAALQTQVPALAGAVT